MRVRGKNKHILGFDEIEDVGNLVMNESSHKPLSL